MLMEMTQQFLVSEYTNKGKKSFYYKMSVILISIQKEARFKPTRCLW